METLAPRQELREQAVAPSVIGAQFGRLALCLPLTAEGPAGRRGRDHPGGDNYFGARRASSIPSGLSTDISAPFPRLGEPFHLGSSACHDQFSGQSTDLLFSYGLSGNSIRVTGRLAFFWALRVVGPLVWGPLLRRVDHFRRTHRKPAEFSSAFT